MTNNDHEHHDDSDAESPSVELLDTASSKSDYATVVIVAALNAQRDLAETIEGLRGAGLNNIVVVDDGSVDGTTDVAHQSGVAVLRNPVNRGKGYCIDRAVQHFPNADAYLLVDADTRGSATSAVELLEPIKASSHDLVIGALPDAQGKGGFGLVKNAAIRGIKRACGLQVSSPLSGQRAVKGSLLRELQLESRFGVEVGMTIDAVRLGARVKELPLEMEHRHRGRSLNGFVHRGRQGLQIARALLLRTTTPLMRSAVFGLLVFVALAAVFLSAIISGPRSESAFVLPKEHKVVVVPGLTWADIKIDDRLPRGIWGTHVMEVNSPVLADVQAMVAPGAQVRRTFEEAVGQVHGDLASVIIGEDDDAGSRPRPLFISSVTAGGAEGLLESADTRRSGFVPRSKFIEDLAGDDSELTYYRSMSSADAARNAKSTANSLTFGLEARPLAIAVFGLAAMTMTLGFLFVVMRPAIRTDRPRFRKALASLALWVASFPVVALVMNLFNPIWVSWQAPPVAAVIATCALTAIVAALFKGSSSSNWAALRWIMFATVMVIVVDLLSGSHLQFGGVFGSDPAFGRYYGLGNPTAVLLLTATVLFIAMSLEVAVRRTEAAFYYAAGFLLVAAIAGFPGLGSDVGSLIVFGLVGIVAGVVGLRKLQSRNLRLAGIVVGVGMLMMGVGAAVIDSLRPVSQQTHLGRLITGVSGDGTSLQEVVLRKLERNVFDYLFPLSPLLVLAAVVLFLVLWRTTVGESRLGANSVARAGTLTALGGAIAMYGANDSGVVVLALAVVYGVPFVLFRGSKDLGPVEVSAK